MASPVQDLKKLSTSGTAATGELREFLQRMKGRSAAQVLDSVSESGLFKGLVTASIGMAALIALLTVAPYVWGELRSGEGGEERPAQVETQPGAVAKEPEPDGEDAGADPGSPAAPAAGTGATAPPLGAAEALGIGESVEVPLDVNPLESATDDLLQGLE